MARIVQQYCKKHKEIEDYPACATDAPDGARFSRPATMHPSERPIVWQHPVTKEVRYPGRNDGEMPSYYKSQGYQKVEIPSYQEHQKFCKEQGVVNHAAEGIK